MAHNTPIVVERLQEFQDFLPPLTAEERAGLSQKLQSESCWQLFPYAVIDGRNVQLDGYNRRSICDELNIEYGFTLISEVTTTEQAVDWIVQHALSQRNLDPNMRRYYRGRAYLKAKKPTGNPEITPQCGHDVHIGRTSEKQAKTERVSERTIRRNAELAEAVDSRLCDRCKRIGVPSCEKCRKLLKDPVVKRAKPGPKRTTGKV